MIDDSTMTARLPWPRNPTAEESDDAAEAETYEATVPDLTVPEFLPTDELKQLLDVASDNDEEDEGFNPYDRS